jgi:tripartite motif-containing protein 71
MILMVVGIVLLGNAEGETYKFVLKIPSSQQWFFSYPSGVAVDSSGNVYVADSGNHRIQKFNSSGSFITKWDSYGPGDGQFYSPYGFAVDSSDNVYVADSENGRIQKFDAAGNFITKWGSYGSGDGQFYSPYGFAVDSSGNV